MNLTTAKEPTALGKEPGKRKELGGGRAKGKLEPPRAHQEGWEWPACPELLPEEEEHEDL